MLPQKILKSRHLKIPSPALSKKFFPLKRQCQLGTEYSGPSLIEIKFGFIISSCFQSFTDPTEISQREFSKHALRSPEMSHINVTLQL